MNLQQFARKWHEMCSRPYGHYQKRHLTLLVELPNGQKQWFRASPKIEYAIKLHKKQHGKLPQNYFAGTYINVPLTPYFGRNNGIIGVGKILRWRYYRVYNSKLCTRSQFVTKDALVSDWRKAYHYLKHDYGYYSRLNIFIDLYEWKKKEK